MRRSHWTFDDASLLIGGAGIAVLLLVAVYGPAFAPHDIDFVISLKGGKPPPFDPGPGIWLGTDAFGRDLWSWVLIGARVTLLIAFAAGALRVAVGAFLGTMAGWQGGHLDLVTSRLALGFSSIPSTVLALLGVIAFNINAGPLAFALALGLGGWGEVFQFARRAARSEGHRPYIEAARSLGLDEQRVVVRHLVPNLAPTLIALTALQISAVLLVLAELGLLQIFVGGGVTEFTPAGQAITVASVPDWSSMLASARPIRAVGGDEPWPVLAPALALLFAIGTLNFFGDALARRAQRIDIYRLFGPRVVIALALVLAAALLPAFLLPNPLARDIRYADGLDASLALAAAQELAAPGLGGRFAGSEGAARAAELLRTRLSGETEPVHARELTPDLFFVGPYGALTFGSDLELYSLDDGALTGPVVAVSPFALLHGGADLRGAIILVSGGFDADRTATLARTHGAVAVVYVSAAPLPFPAVASAYAVPVLRASPDPLQRVLGRPLPEGFDVGRFPPTQLAESVRLSVHVRFTPIDGVNVIARVPAAHDAAEAPVIVLVARYEEAGPPRYLDRLPGWPSASSAALLVAVLDRLRADPVEAEVIGIAATAQEHDSAGFKAALAALPATERQRITAIVFVMDARGVPVLQSDSPDRNNPSASNVSGRIARKIADILSLRTEAERARPLSLAARTVAVAAPTFAVASFAPQEEPPSLDGMHQTGRAVLTLVSYVARRPVELQQ